MRCCAHHPTRGGAWPLRTIGAQHAEVSADPAGVGEVLAVSCLRWSALVAVALGAVAERPVCRPTATPDSWRVQMQAGCHRGGQGMRRRRRTKAGFTLIELMVVIMI